MSTARPAPPDEALAMIASHEVAPGIGPVDEGEERRLRGHPPFREDDWTWAPWFVDGPSGVTYLGLRRPPDGSGPAVVELVPADRAGDPTSVRAGLAAAGVLAGGPAEVWLRGISPADLAAATSTGATVVRSMRVLGRPLEGLPAAARPAVGVDVRPWRPGDDDGVVAVLSAAHPDGRRGWTRDELERRRSATWFRAEDLLVAEEAGRVLGVHWLKRRGGRVGEVHNLALHPAAQGRGLGGALLDAGLRHLADVGCDEVLLWVDDANPRALELYRSRGFAELARDVVLRV